MKKKTIYVSIILIIVAIGVVFGFIQNILSLINIKALMTSSFANSVTLNIVNLVLSIISTVLLFVYFIKLYNLPQNIIKWTNIVFGYSIFNLIFSLIVALFTVPLLFVILGSIPVIIISIIIVIVWFTFVRHLKKNKDKLLLGDYKSTNITKESIKKYIKILGIILTIIVIILIVRRIISVDIVDSKLILLQDKIKLTDSIPTLTICDTYFVNDTEQEINNIGKEFQCFRNNDHYAIIAKREKRGYFCIDSNNEKRVISSKKFNLINKDSIYCSDVNPYKELSVEKNILGTFRIVDTGEVFEYYTSVNADSSDNPITSCINLGCDFIYFKNIDVGKISLFNDKDTPVVGHITKTVFYSGDKIVSKLSPPYKLGDSIEYSLSQDGTTNHNLDVDELCRKWSDGSIHCGLPRFKLGDKIMFSFKGFTYLFDDVIKTQLIKYQYFTIPDNEEVYPVVELKK